MGSLASGATNSLVAKIGTKDSATWDHLQVAPQTPWWPKLELKIRPHLAESIEKITQLFQVEFSFQKRHLNHTTISHYHYHYHHHHISHYHYHYHHHHISHYHYHYY